MIAFISGCLVIHLIFLAEILRTHAVQEWLNQTFIWPYRWAQGRGMGPLRILKSLFLYEISQSNQGQVVFERWGALLGMTLLFGALLFHARKYPEKTGVWFYSRIAALLAGLVVLNFACVDFITTVRPLSFLIPVSVLVFFLADGLAWWRGKTPRGTALISAVSLFCFASWLQYYPVMCFRHIFWSISPFIGLFVYFVYRETQWNAKYVYWGIGLLALPLLMGDFQRGQVKLSAPYEDLSGVKGMGGIKARPEIVRQLSTLDAKIQDYEAHHGKTPLLLDGPNALPGVMSSDLRNSTPFYVQWVEYPHTPEDEARRDGFVRNQRPLIVVQNSRIAVMDKWLQPPYDYAVILTLHEDVGVLLAPR